MNDSFCKAHADFISKAQKCGGTVTASEGWLGFDDKTLSEDTYTHTLDCWWTILSDHDKQIQLQLVGYEANCSDGYLEVYYQPEPQIEILIQYTQKPP